MTNVGSYIDLNSGMFGMEAGGGAFFRTFGQGAVDDSRSSLSRLRPDAVARFLTPSPDRSQRRRFMPATPSPRTVCINLQEIWCREERGTSLTRHHPVVQNGCSFHGLRSEDPDQHLKDFLKLVDSLDLDGDNRERRRLHLFQFSLRDQASNWLEHFPAGSITTWEDHTTQSLSEAWTHFKDLLQKIPHHGIDLWLQVQIFYDHVNLVTRRTIDQLADGKLRDLNAEESWALLEDLALYDNKSWNDPKDFAKPVKAIVLPQDVPSTSDCRLIELKNQVQRLMEAHLAPTQPTQMNKITTSYEICSGPHDTQYCMENPEQAFVEYASSRTDEAGAHSEEANISQTSLSQTRTGMVTKQLKEPKLTLEDEFQDLHLNLPVLEVLAHAPIYNAILDKYVESLELGKNGSSFVQGEVPTKMEDPGLFTLPCRLGDSKPFDTLADLGSCKDPETPLLVGRGFLANANAVIDCRMVKIAGGEGITRSVFSVKGVDLGEEQAPYWTTLGKRESYKPRPSSDGVGAKTPYYARKDFLDCHLPEEWEISKDVELNPFKDTLVFMRMDKPPKNEDGARHAKIRLIDPDGEEFTKTLQSIPTTRKLSERESPREIINLDHFYDT
ncbi:hypothetical protein Tco_0379373 [Tanacetum coccineum]